MQRVINSLSGNVRLEVEAAYPERFMNLCAQNNIAFWDLERVDAVTIRVTVSIAGWRRLKPLLKNLDAKVRQVRRAGAPVFLWRIRRRYALFAGLIATLVAIWVMSMFIWDIQVTGNETVPASEILQALEQAGVGIGTYGPSIDPELLRNEVLLYLDDVAWITVNVNGSRATVVVRERVEAPEIISSDVATAVYATKSGVIDQMIVWEGEALYQVGDTVNIGDDLVSGRVDSLASGTRSVHADAEIYARTWYDLSMSMPLELAEKQYTGKTSTKSTIIFGDNRLNLFFDGGNSYEAYDKLLYEKDLTLPGGIILPIKLQRQVYTEYEPVYSLFTDEEAEEILEARLLARLEELLNPGGEILETAFTTEIEDGVITVTLQAECREQIAAVRKLSEDELTAPAPVTDNGEEIDAT